MTVPTSSSASYETGHKGRGWSVLLIAGGFEIGYALSVKGSVGFTNPVWSFAAVVFFLLTMLFLSLALKHIDVGIGYAVWTGIGAVGAAVLGPVFYDESLTWTKALWLAAIIAGAVWLKQAGDTTPVAIEQAEH
ncbi:DMT family transporter [Brevibacterium atlanticum]|uniref:DMT family transporter n=1 Tax=Brevibacterium atlanticum TaxID=2697563 RepID=UPI0014223606|nr:multidrug efflux SMR transporter [Brevibacterium atlanticum]